MADGSEQLDAQNIVRRSVAVTQANWQQKPNFVEVERDEDTKGGRTTSETNTVMMIDGTPYNRLIARDGKPLSPEEEAQQTKHLQEEVARRSNESPQERAKRLEKYQKDYQRMFVMMRDMMEAFDFHLTGEEKLEGHNNYVLSATPRPGYKPDNRETKMLTGMQGKLWIDREDYQWFRIEVEVTKPVWFGLFIAKIYPGTQFLLEQAPVQEGIWLPKHFRVEVKASILLFHKNFTHDETYQDYRPITGPISGRRSITNKVKSN